MADTKISALSAASTPLGGTEVLPIVQSSTTVNVSIANLTAGRAVSASSLTVTTSITNSAFSAAGVVTNNSSGLLASVAPGTSGNLLTSNGTSWVSSTPSSSGISTGKAIAMAMVFGF